MPISKHCAKCGAPITVPVGRVKDRNYCSVKCANADRHHGLRRPEVSNAVISALYIDGDESAERIADRFGVSKSTVCRRLKRMGLTKSPHGHEGRNGKRGTVLLNGYPVVYLPSHHRAKSNGYVKEHIIVAEKMLGRRLLRGEVVHHINEDKTDNAPENLMVFSGNEKHMRYHSRLRKFFDS